MLVPHETHTKHDVILKKIHISVHVSYLLYWHLPRIQCASLCTIIYNGRTQCSLWSVKHFLMTPLQHIRFEIKQCLQIVLQCWPKTVLTVHIPVVYTHCRNGNTFLTLETIVSQRHLKWRSVYSHVFISRWSLLSLHGDAWPKYGTLWYVMNPCLCLVVTFECEWQNSLKWSHCFNILSFLTSSC